MVSHRRRRAASSGGSNKEVGILASLFIDISTSASLAMPPAALAQLRLRLQASYPALRSEYVQVLVLVVVPLIFLLAVLLLDLVLRRRVFAHNGYFTFRPSFAVRCAWIFTILALLADPFASHHPLWIVVAADLLAALELLRTFPRKLILGSDGLHWRNITGPVVLPWEQVSCFAKSRSPFGTEYRLFGNEGQTFVINSLVLPGWEQIVRRISLNLEQRYLKPSSAVPQSALDTLHRLIVPACLLVIVLGRHIAG
jgi:hypothetical protein